MEDLVKQVSICVSRILLLQVKLTIIQVRQEQAIKSLSIIQLLENGTSFLIQKQYSVVLKLQHLLQTSTFGNMMELQFNCLRMSKSMDWVPLLEKTYSSTLKLEEILKPWSSIHSEALENCLLKEMVRLTLDLMTLISLMRTWWILVDNSVKKSGFRMAKAHIKNCTSTSLQRVGLTLPLLRWTISLKSRLLQHGMGEMVALMALMNQLTQKKSCLVTKVWKKWWLIMTLTAMDSLVHQNSNILMTLTEEQSNFLKSIKTMIHTLNSMKL